jgi:glutamate racemase
LNQQPIGIFDSGIGGLTLAHALREALPYEDVLYVGDTAHLPYGEKSAEAIQHYSRAITRWFVSRGCKLILVGCNSASSSALEVVQAEAKGKAMVVDVMHPVVHHIAVAHPHTQLGILGTVRTVEAGTYPALLQQHAPHVVCRTQAAPLLAAAIENHLHDDDIMDELLHAYLKGPALKGIKTLLLACTHYPIIEPRIQAILPEQVQIIDSVGVVVQAVHAKLKQEDALKNHALGTQHCYVTDYTDAFERGAARFFGEAIKLEYVAL